MIIAGPYSSKLHKICQLSFLHSDALCGHTSLVVSGFVMRSRQIGHISSLRSARGDTATTVESVTISCGLRCSSYRLSSVGENICEQ